MEEAATLHQHQEIVMLPLRRRPGGDQQSVPKLVRHCCARRGGGGAAAAAASCPLREGQTGQMTGSELMLNEAAPICSLRLTPQTTSCMSFVVVAVPGAQKGDDRTGATTKGGDDGDGCFLTPATSLMK